MNQPSADNSSSVKPRTVFGFGLRVVLGLLFVALAAGVVTVVLTPKKYFSEVTMQVQPDAAAASDQSAFTSPPQSYDPQFIHAQMAILQTTEMLYPVIERLDLTKGYAAPGTTISREKAYQRLRAAMKMQELRNSGLIEIGISDTDPQRAANIANTIAIVYQEKRRNAQVAQTNTGVEGLQAGIEAQRKKVEEASRLAMEIRARNGIADPDPDRESASLVDTAVAPGPNGAPAAVLAAAIATKTKMTEYAEAKRQYLREVKLLEEQEVTYATQTLRTNTPSLGAVIWEKAVAASRPENPIGQLIDHLLR